MMSVKLFPLRHFTQKKNLAKEQLLKKLSRVSRQKDLDQKSKDLNPPPPSELDPAHNTLFINNLLQTIKNDDSHQNEYVKLIERMREMKKESARDATASEIEKAMADFVKEAEDFKATEGTGLRLKRPPRTVKETIETLKEADSRYQGAKLYLFGSQEAAGKAIPSTNDDDIDPLRNVPRGMSLQRLYYPPSKAEIVLVGLRRRVGVHAQFLYDLLSEMRPDSIFVQLPPDLPVFIKNTKPKEG
jgi:hypothetical protein